jgi:hypothetical protein
MKLKSLFLLLPATHVCVAGPALADAVTFYDTPSGFRCCCAKRDVAVQPVVSWVASVTQIPT